MACEVIFFLFIIFLHDHSTSFIIGFFAGVGPAVVGVTPYVGLNFAMYETLKSFTSFTSSSDDLEDSAAVSNFTNWEQLVRLMKKGMLGGIAGGTSKFILFPLVSMLLCMLYRPWF